MDSMARDMFMLPADIKERAIYPIFNTGYAPPKTGPQGKDSLPESIVFPNDSSVGDISSKLWPHGNHKFREMMQEYNSEMREVSHGILKVILCSLGLDISEHYSSPLFDKSQGWLRVNFYIHRFSIKMPTPSMRNIPKRGQVKAAIASSLAHSVRSLLRPSKSFNYSAASSSSSRATVDLLRAQ